MECPVDRRLLERLRELDRVRVLDIVVDEMGVRVAEPGQDRLAGAVDLLGAVLRRVRGQADPGDPVALDDHGGPLERLLARAGDDGGVRERDVHLRTSSGCRWKRNTSGACGRDRVATMSRRP